MHVHMPVHRDEVTGQTWYHFTFPSHTKKAPSFYILLIENKKILLDFEGRRGVMVMFYTDLFGQKPRGELITALAGMAYCP